MWGPVGTESSGSCVCGETPSTPTHSKKGSEYGGTGKGLRETVCLRDQLGQAQKVPRDLGKGVCEWI